MEEIKVEKITKEKFNLLKMHPLAILFVIVYAILCIMGGIGAIFALAIGAICGDHAAKNWAPEIKGSQTWAFVISFTFNLIGFFVYWLYYRDRLKNVK